MSEVKLYKQRAIVVEIPEPKTYGPKMSKKLAITYTRPDTETPNTPLTVGAFESELDDATKKCLVRGEKAILKAGDEVCITKAATGKFWTLVAIGPVTDAPIRTEKSSFSSSNKAGGYSNNKPASTYSAGGQTIGMAIKAAVDLYIYEGGAPTGCSPIEVIGNNARDIMRLSATMDVEYNNGEFKQAITKTTTTASAAVAEIDELTNLEFN